MTNRKKLIIILSTLCVVFLAIICTTIIVLVAGNQNATSKINIEYVVTDADVEVRAGVYYASNTNKTTFYTDNNTSILRLNPSNKTGTLTHQASQLNLTASYPKAIFEYYFQNNNATIPAKVSLTGLPNVQNIKFSYVVRESQLNNMANLNMQGATDTLDDQILINSNFAPRTIYIIAELVDIYSPATITGSFNWTITKTEAVGVTLQNSVTGTTSTLGVASGAKFYEPNWNAVNNKRFNGWYVDENCTTLATFPMTITSGFTTLYAGYQDGNIPDSAYIQAGTNEVHILPSAIEYINATSVVVPDLYYNSTSGISGKVTYIYARNETEANYSYFRHGLLSMFQSTTSLYLGNYVKDAFYLVYNNSYGNVTLRYVELGRSTENLYSCFNYCEGLADIKFFDNTNVSFCHLGGYDYDSKDYYIDSATFCFEGCNLINAKTGYETALNNSEYLVAYTVDTTVTDTADIAGWDSIGTFVGMPLSGAGFVTATIPQNLTKVSVRMFENCKSLQSITIGDQVTEIQQKAFNGCSALQSVRLPYNLTEIPTGCFMNCTSLTQIELPYNMETIGTSAFNGCSSLENIYWPYNLTTISISAFEDSGLKEVVIPSTVQTIESNSFDGCASLEKVTIGAGVQEISNQAFNNCTGLTEINFNAISCSDLASDNKVLYNAGTSASGISLNIGSGVTKVPAYLFNPNNNSTYSPKIMTITFEDGSKCSSIGNYAFAYLNKVEEVVIPESVTTYGQYVFAYTTKLNKAIITAPFTSGAFMFYNCTALKEVSLPEGQTSIPIYMFYICSNLENINLPNSVQSIGIYAFVGARKLKEITIPENVASIGQYAFNNCREIKTINFNATNCANASASNYIFNYVGYNTEGVTLNIGKNVTTIPRYMFSPTGSSNTTFKLTNVVFEADSVCTKIDYYAFRYCAMLKSVVLPNGVTTIAMDAFRYCIALESITIPSSVTNIQVSAFANCTSLKSVIINGKLTTIASNLFDGCTLLEEVILPNTVETIYARAFGGCTALKNITIPSSVTKINANTFNGCTALSSVEFKNTTNWVAGSVAVDVSNPSNNATNLVTTYVASIWTRS